MGDLILREWRRNELRRIYVNDADTREPIGFFDRTTGEIVVRYKARERDVLVALEPFLLVSAPIAAQRRADARRPNRVLVEPDRTVALPLRQVELEPVESTVQPELLPLPSAPEMDVDLSTDIDGATMQDRAAQAVAAPRVIRDLTAGLASTFAAQMRRGPAPARIPVAPRIPPPSRPPSRPGGGTRVVGKRLDRLRRDGWRILDAVRPGDGAVVDHVAIGRPGVFTVRAWNHAKARISVDGAAVQVNGTEHAYLDECRAEAENVARRLSSAGPNVRVTAVLALVDIDELDLSRASADFIVCRGEMVDHVLRDLPGILTNRDQMRVYDLACRPDTWRA